jgi:arsenate reductase (thioredoxin)
VELGVLAEYLFPRGIHALNAEGSTRALKGDIFDVYSAGVESHGVNPRAIEVMSAAGVANFDQRSNTVAELPDVTLDYVVTVCDNARERCPLFTDATHLVHVGFDDPAAAEGTEDEIMAEFRRIRDEIRRFVQHLPESLTAVEK